MNPISFFHIAFQILWQRQPQLIGAFLVPDSHLHVSDRYIVLFKSRRIWIFDSNGLFKNIKWFPGFIQLLAGLLRCLGWKLSIPQISFMRFLLIIPVRILLQLQFFISTAFIVADIPEFGSRICPIILEYSGRILTDVLWDNSILLPPSDSHAYEYLQFTLN
mgnify:CR=1 FL=1